jgi:hypothetical protein
MPSWSGFWDHVNGAPHSLIDSNAARRRFRTAIGDSVRSPYNRILRALAGAAVGGTASGTYNRVAAQPDKDGFAVGGYRGVEAEVTINRATVAADLTNVQKDLDTKLSPTWPVDKSGNGGGGKNPVI